jgi:hypothetical protein
MQTGYVAATIAVIETQLQDWPAFVASMCAQAVPS